MIDKRIAVVILNWNGAKLLEQYLHSVVAYSDEAKIYVIDNASTDNSIAVIKEKFPTITIIKNDGNYGFAKGYNLALKKYPLRREIKYIIKEAHQGLGTGFLNYVSGDLGQLIVLKAGLIPLTRPITIRTYQISQ